MIGTPANDTTKGAAVLAEARKALGGEDRFKAVQRLEVKGKSARAAGNNNIEGDFEVLLELPGKYRRKENISMNDFGIEILQILNGGIAIEEIATPGRAGSIGGFEGGGGDFGGERGRGGRGNQNNIAAALLGGGNADPEARQRSLAAEMARTTLSLLLTTTEPVAWIGMAESPDGKANVLEFKTADGIATRLLVDEKTHTPLMMAWTGVASGLPFNNRRGGGGGRQGQGGQQQAQGRRGGATAGQIAPLQMYFSDYKTVNGIRLPHLIQRGANDETTEELVVKTYRINPSFRPDTFQK